MEIYYYRLEVYQAPRKYSFQEDKFNIQKMEILAENDRFIVFNDAAFSKIYKSEKDPICYSCLNKPSVSFKDCLGQKGIFYTLYADSKVRPSTIERQIKKKADSEYGYLFSNNLDLSILKKAANNG